MFECANQLIHNAGGCAWNSIEYVKIMSFDYRLHIALKEE